jgi:2-iminoacetate synthase
VYDPKSSKAEEFISHEEILASIDYAEKQKNNRELIESILERAKDCKGVPHRDALLLVECEIPELNEKILELAHEIKERFYGNRIVMFAPLYLLPLSSQEQTYPSS